MDDNSLVQNTLCFLDELLPLHTTMLDFLSLKLASFLYNTEKGRSQGALLNASYMGLNWNNCNIKIGTQFSLLNGPLLCWPAQSIPWCTGWVSIFIWGGIPVNILLFNFKFIKNFFYLVKFVLPNGCKMTFQNSWWHIGLPAVHCRASVLTIFIKLLYATLTWLLKDWK